MPLFIETINQSGWDKEEEILTFNNILVCSNGNRKNSNEIQFQNIDYKQIEGVKFD